MKQKILEKKYLNRLEGHVKFEEDIFKYERIRASGLYIVQIVNGLMNDSWSDGFSVEPVPQHWSYKLLMSLKIKNSKVYRETIGFLKYTESKLFNPMGDKSMPLLIREQEALINFVAPLVLTQDEIVTMAEGNQMLLVELVKESGIRITETKIVLHALMEKKKKSSLRQGD